MNYAIGSTIVIAIQDAKSHVLEEINELSGAHIIVLDENHVLIFLDPDKNQFELTQEITDIIDEEGS